MVRVRHDLRVHDGTEDAARWNALRVVQLAEARRADVVRTAAPESQPVDGLPHGRDLPRRDVYLAGFAIGADAAFVLVLRFANRTVDRGAFGEQGVFEQRHFHLEEGFLHRGLAGERVTVLQAEIRALGKRQRTGEIFQLVASPLEAGRRGERPAPQPSQSWPVTLPATTS